MSADASGLILPMCTYLSYEVMNFLPHSLSSIIYAVGCKTKDGVSLSN